MLITNHVPMNIIMEYYPTIKIQENPSCDIDVPESIILSEISLTEEGKYCMISHICETEKQTPKPNSHK